jgi:hypothetical protein
MEPVHGAEGELMIYRLMLAAFLAALAFGAQAQIPGWTKGPSITVLGAADDPRIQLVREAVDFWNATLTETPTPFRLGKLTVAPNPIPDAQLQRLSETMLAGQAGKLPMPDGVRAAPGDLVIALAGTDFVSFTARWPDQNKALVAIKNHAAWPLTLPNVLRNVIAHEIGHAIGLIHNSDPSALMCGRPADCRPDSFISREVRYFPLTPQDRANLKRMYPIDWAAY